MNNSYNSDLKVGSRVEVLAHSSRHKSIYSWQLGRIVGTVISAGKQYWQVRLDRHTTLEWLPFEKDSTDIHHSDALLPDVSGRLTQRQVESGRFQVLTDGGILEGIEKINQEVIMEQSAKKATQDVVEAGQQSVSLTNLFQVGDLMIKTNEYRSYQELVQIVSNQSGYSPNAIKYLKSGKILPLLDDSINKWIEDGVLLPATFDEKLSYLKAEADRLDTIAADAITARAEVQQEIMAIYDAKFYEKNFAESPNFRAKYPTFEDYRNEIHEP